MSTIDDEPMPAWLVEAEDDVRAKRTMGLDHDEEGMAKRGRHAETSESPTSRRGHGQEDVLPPWLSDAASLLGIAKEAPEPSPSRLPAEHDDEPTGDVLATAFTDESDVGLQGIDCASESLPRDVGECEACHGWLGRPHGFPPMCNVNTCPGSWSPKRRAQPSSLWSRCAETLSQSATPS
jgi:hypothetical protein